MYLSNFEHKEILEKIERLENVAVVLNKLDTLLHARVLGCVAEEELAEVVGENADEDGFLDPELFTEVAAYHSDSEIWSPDAHERISLAEYTDFLQTWLKIIDDESHLESLVTLGAILMRKERKSIAGDLKQVRDIRFKLFEREKRLEEFV